MADFSNVEFDTSNPEPRCPCVLILDTSTSMEGKPLAELNAGLVTLKDELSKDKMAMLRVELAIVTFGPVNVLQDFVGAMDFNPPTLSTTGSTPMGEATNKALDIIEARKEIYKQQGVSYFRPWCFLITDGGPDPNDDWRSAGVRVHEAESKKRLAFFSVGVENAEMSVLQQMSPRQPLKLKGLNFRDMFIWLSSSLTSVSHSKPLEEVPMQSPLGWGVV